MADRYTITRTLKDLAECAGRNMPDEDKLEPYFRTLASIENAQLIACVPALKTKHSATIPSASAILKEAQKQRFSLEPQRVKLIDILGNIHEAELTGSNRVQYCPKCKRVMGNNKSCSLCNIGVPE